jgi:hypothetical protein
VRLGRLATLAVLLAGVAGCGGVRLEEGSYVVRDKGYRVGAPPGWAPVKSDADLVLRRAAAGAGLMAHATCDGKPPRRPFPILARHLRFGLRDIQGLVEEPVTLGGLPGVAQGFRATLDGVPVAVRAVTLRGATCVYDLVGVASPDGVGALTLDFERFTAGFAASGAAR